MDKYQGIATEISNAVGEKSNVASYTNWMTRLTLVDSSIADLGAVRDIDGVIRVVGERGLHIILEYVVVNKVAECFGQIIDAK